MQREHEYANMKYRLRNFPLIRLPLLYFILLLSEKMYFIAKIFNIHMISMRLSCIQMYAEAYLEPTGASMVEFPCKN